MTANQPSVLASRLLSSENESGTAPEDRFFRPDIEGLRAVAVTLVVIAHVGVMVGGVLGVDVFFVISGFVITGVLLRARDSTGTIYFMTFYGRRARRILPAAVLVIIASLVAERLIVGVGGAHVVASEARWAAVFAANFNTRSVTDVFLIRPEPLQPYWSLAVEEQFYLVYPLCFFAVAMIGRRWTFLMKLGVFLTAVVAISFIWSVVSSPSFTFTAYVSPFTRAWELACGALLAVATGTLKKLPKRVAAIMTWVGIAGIVAMSFVLRLDVSYPFAVLVLPVAATSLVIAGGTSVPRAGSEILLKLAPFKWVGRWSYSLYLWHYAVLIIGLQALHQSKLRSSLTTNFLLVMIALPLAVGTYFAVEQPIRHSRLLSRSPAASLAMGALLIATCLVATFII